MIAASRVRAAVERHPRWWGLAFAGLLLAAYLFVIRPGRVVFAQSVARPLLEAIGTPRARAFAVVPSPRQRVMVFAVPTGAMSEAEREAGTAQWSAPVGVLFILPAMFLIGAFPTRPYWLYLLAYHVALGVVALAAFAVGLGWLEAAFSLYTFSQTYMTETVSLAVPLLLWLAGRAGEGDGREGQSSEATAAA